MLTLFVVLALLALLAPAEHHPRRRNVGNSMQFRKRDNITDGVFPYTTQLSALSIRETAKRSKIAKRTGHEDYPPSPPKISVPIHETGKGWAATIFIGITKFSVLIDTYGTDLWVVSSDCKNPPSDCKAKYVPKAKNEAKEAKSEPEKAKSETEKAQSDKDFLVFLTSEMYKTAEIDIEGTVRTDEVTLGGVKITEPFGAATKVPTTFPCDGSLGLPLASKTSMYETEPNFLHRVFKKQKMTSIFAIYPAGSNSRLHLGGVDKKAYIGEFEYHEVIESTLSRTPYWVLGNCHITVTGETSTRPLEAHIDTGTDLIFGPAKEVKELYKHIRGSKVSSSRKSWTFPCDPAPKLTISWGKKKWPIPRFNVQAYGQSQEYCVGAIQVAHKGTSGAGWRIGTRGLDMYAMYDVEKKQVGFAERA